MVLRCFGKGASAPQRSDSTAARTAAHSLAVTSRSGASVLSTSTDIDAAKLLPPWVDTANNSKRTGAESPGQATAATATTTVSDVINMNIEEASIILQKVASLNPTPTVALCEAVEILQHAFNAALVSIVGVCDPTTFVLLAAHGKGSTDLEAAPVMRGPHWSAARLLGGAPHLQASARAAADADALPRDWATLHRAGAASSFLAVPILHGGSVLGVLAITSAVPDAFDAARWVPLLRLISTGLLPHLRSEQTQQVAALLAQLDATPDHLQFVGQLLRGLHVLLLSCTNITCGCRLGIMDNDMLKTMIFECDQLSPQDAMSLSLARASAASAPSFFLEHLAAPHDVHVITLPLANTLLLDAVHKGKARFVSDCTLYLQSCMKPAADIFISAAHMVASIVVMPLLYQGSAFGGLYFTLDTPCNFLNLKDPLTGFANVAVPLLTQRLHSPTAAVWAALQQGAVPMDAGGAGAGGGEGGLAAGAAGGMEGDALGSASGGSNSGSAASPLTTRPVYHQKSATEGIMKVLRSQIQKSKAQADPLEWVEGLQLVEVVGRGGFGMVYRGRWKGSVAAVKVMYASKQERQQMKDALEIAVLTSVSHPNIIQVYECSLDMVEDPNGLAAAAEQQGTQVEPGGLPVGFRKLQNEEASAVTCNLVIMEYCDKGSLRHALKRSVFHRRVGTTSLQLDLTSAILVLLEVAQAIHHLHTLKLIHCDIKPENVLLKSDPTKPIGFTTKLSDFGLAKILRDNYYVVNRSGSGTVTHLAPELFLEGSRLTTAVDSFSFGIMMWELYTGQRAYSGMGRDAIIDRVYRNRGRPLFPVGALPEYVELACACWHDIPNQRPTFDLIPQRLNDLLLIARASDPPILQP